MNAYPFIPPLDPKAVKELCRQIRVIKSDYPHLSDDELAQEWAERQEYQVESGRPSPFTQWIAESRWEIGFQKALAFAVRQRAQKQRAKDARQRYKEYRQDKEPATARQQRYVARLAKERELKLDVAPDQMSKLAASRMISKLINPSS
jgi:hypothetical protein